VLARKALLVQSFLVGGLIVMEDTDETMERTDDLIRLANGIVSNLENLQTLSEMQGFLPEQLQSLEIAIEAQTRLLNGISDTDGEVQMPEKVGMGDFVRGKCKTAKIHQSLFVNSWYDTRGKPCLQCAVDKSKCDFHQKLVEENPGIVG
jgi:hypothetical protein